MDARLLIVGMGAATPIGRSVWSSAAAARAGLCGFCEHPFMIDTAGEPMRVARAPWLEIALEGSARYGALLLPALDAAIEPLRTLPERERPRLALMLALPPPRPGVPADLIPSLRDTLAERLAGICGRIECFAAGHAGGHLALEAAVRACSGNALDAVLVAGADSYLAPETLEWIESCDQLHGAGPLNNAWGFIPGEAAGALLLATDACAARRRLDAFGEVAGLGLGRETCPIKTDTVCIGAGLTAAFRAALANLAPAERIHNVFCDLNGEPYRADEYGFASLRTQERFRAATEFIAPADCWGDIGAAGVPLHIALALIAQRKRYGKGPLSLVWASSESGERGAAVIRGLDPVMR